MNAEEIAALARQTMEQALEDRRKQDEAAAAAKAAEEAKISAAVEQALKAQAAEFAKARRLPDKQAETRQAAPGAPYVTAFHDTRKFDGLSLEDQAFVCAVLDSAKRDGRSQGGVSNAALKALAIKIAEDTGKLGDEARGELKAAGLDPRDVLSATKANELDYSTSAGYGDEWVGIEYSRRFWNAVRARTFVAAKLPSVVVPDGAESIYVPIESTDPSWYLVSQATANNSTTLRPNGTVTSSRIGTNRVLLTVNKMGARVTYSAELEEDSLVPWAAQLRMQLELSGADVLEHTIIDGHTTTSATTNINYIDGTPGGTEVYLMYNGFRVSSLVTTTANSRSASGAFSSQDFLETLKLMGTAGLNGSDPTKVSFIIDPNVNWKAMSLPEVKTRDVFANPTIEQGRLKQIWGYDVDVSYNMHKQSAKRMANTAGKVDSTDSNNTTGAIVAVRWDQWLLGYKRRIQIKTQEFIDADASQLVALARVGLIQRDTEATAETYNVGV